MRQIHNTAVTWWTNSRYYLHQNIIYYFTELQQQCLFDYVYSNRHRCKVFFKMVNYVLSLLHSHNRDITKQKYYKMQTRKKQRKSNFPSFSKKVNGTLKAIHYLIIINKSSSSLLSSNRYKGRVCLSDPYHKAKQLPAYFIKANRPNQRNLSGLFN